MGALLFNIFICIGLIYTVHIALYLIGANLYDINSFRRKKSSKRGTKRPLVTVVMAAYNEEIGIISCLDSIRKNRHRKFEVIVVDNGSTDSTRELVRQFIAKHPTRNFRLVARRINSGKGASITYGIKKYARGELVMTLDADTILDKYAIKNAVTYFNNPNIQAVAANVKIIPRPSVINLLQRFEHMIGYRSKKFYTLANCEYIVGGVASTYRLKTMKKVHFYDNDTKTEDIGLSLKVAALGNKSNKIIYGADVLATTDGVQTLSALLRQRYRWKMGGLQNLIRHRGLLFNNDKKYSKSLTYYRLPMAFLGEALIMLEPIVLGYVVYLSIVYKTPELFIGAYAMMVAHTLLTVFTDEHISLKRKITLSLHAPIIYFVFYIMSLVQVVSIYRCVLSFNQILFKTKAENTWTSPIRSKELVY